jgi:hypothetical protein
MRLDPRQLSLENKFGREIGVLRASQSEKRKAEVNGNKAKREEGVKKQQNDSCLKPIYFCDVN